jgi:quercetin dioxygenase-like cupin family protein
MIKRRRTMTVLQQQAGQRVQVFDDQVCIKLKSQNSDNRMTVVTVDVPPGSMVAPHVHLHEEESYYMLEGSITVQVAGEETLVKSGDFVHIPPGTAHSYRNDSSQPSRFLAWAIGGSLDEFFLEIGATIKSVPDDLAKLPAILDRHGIQMAN